MGNGVGKLSFCFTGDGDSCRRHDVSVLVAEPLDEGLGHSFCYVRPDPTRISCSKVHSEDETTTFRAISGASVSANASTPLSTSILDFYAYGCIDKSSTFESSTSFSSIPLQPIPRCSVGSGPLSGNFDRVPGSGPLERGFLSGPIERGFLSGPLDRGIFSGPLENGGSDQFKRSFSHADSAFRQKSRKGRLIRGIRKAISKRISRGQNSLVAPIKAAKDPYWMSAAEKQHNQLRNENSTISSLYLSSEGSLEDYDTLEGQQSVQWAQGKAGEDRVHVVVSEEREWIFVGIYDGFNGPDAPDYLLSNLYRAIHKELRGLLWDDDKYDLSPVRASEDSRPDMKESLSRDEYDLPRNRDVDACSSCFEQENYPCKNMDVSSDWSSKRKKNSNSRSKHRGPGKKWEENQRKWKCEWDRERLELDRRLKEQLSRSGSHDGISINHCDVLKALSQALNKTEEAFFDIADKMAVENPELALMGSCVLVMLMKGEDVYVMNVGDSRAVLAQKAGPDYRIGKVQQDLEKIKEETLYDIEASDWDQPSGVVNLNAFQLSVDHSTSVEEEVQRIKKEHPDDASALVNDRVKGSLIVTRAFGAGYLKQPKWNDALLKRFRIDYVGSSPYITCSPSLYHHKLGPKDRFLILSSDGLYQYFTNEEAVAAVELFIDLQPEGDPAQHLIEEVLFRAAKKAGIEFHDLLEIPHGDPRRRYHDDISIIIISLEGRIWRSSV